LAAIQSINASRSASFHTAFACLKLGGFDDSVHGFIEPPIKLNWKC
jgi:hypothetical protein